MRYFFRHADGACETTYNFTWPYISKIRQSLEGIPEKDNFQLHEQN